MTSIRLESTTVIPSKEISNVWSAKTGLIKTVSAVLNTNYFSIILMAIHHIESRVVLGLMVDLESLKGSVQQRLVLWCLVQCVACRRPHNRVIRVHTKISILSSIFSISIGMYYVWSWHFAFHCVWIHTVYPDQGTVDARAPHIQERCVLSVYVWLYLLLVFLQPQ